MKMPPFFASRRFRQGSMATAITAVVVALVVVINLVATTLTQRYSLTLDLTPTKLFSVTSETKQYLAGLTKDVTLYVLDTEESFTANGEYFIQAVEVLKKYVKESPRLSLEFVDLVANPGFTQQFPRLQLSATSIVVACGDKAWDIAPYQLYELKTDEFGTYPIASKAEQTLTSAILSVTSDRTVKVAVINGHGEQELTGFSAVLSANNYTVEPLGTLLQDIDPSFDIAILNNPQRDLPEEELKVLDRFLENGGEKGKTLFYLSDSDQPPLPNLDAFLADWGIAVNPGISFEVNPANYRANNPFNAYVQYAEDNYSAPYAPRNLRCFVDRSRPLALLFSQKGDVTTTPLLQFSSTAGVALSAQQLLENIGPIPCLVLSRSTVYQGDEPFSSQVIVSGAAALVDPGMLADPTLANSEYLLSLLGNFTGQDDTIQIQSKDFTSEPLPVNTLQMYVLGTLLTVVFPLTVLVSGIVIWARRRHR